MDPASCVVGVVSLTFQVFSGCVKGYQLITDANGMPKDFQHLRVRLKTEQMRLLDWAHVAHVNERDDDLLISNHSKGSLLDVLDQQCQLLERFGKYDEKYKPLGQPLLSEMGDGSDGHERFTMIDRTASGFQGRFPQTEALLKKSLAFIEGTRKYPKRLKWASWDKAKVEQLLIKLSTLNDFMKELLNTQQLSSLAVKQTRTEYQIVQLNSKIDFLRELVESGFAWNALMAAGSQSRTDPSAGSLRHLLDASGSSETLVELPEQNLSVLAKVKALETAMDSSSLTDQVARELHLGPTASEITSVELSRSNISLDTLSDDAAMPDSQRTSAYYFPPGTYTQARKPIWIEWKPFEPSPLTADEPSPKTAQRIRRLATLLVQNNRIGQFRAPPCLGYFRDIDAVTGEDRCRYGIVFEKPATVAGDSTPVSLLDLLRDESALVPSLTERIALARAVAECLERLHAVNWLHKGLRSDNVLFFRNPNAATADRDSEPSHSGIDLSAPYISGFDYARPALSEHLTERPPENAAYDLYRHPLVHGSGAGNFKKSFDIYSLGVLLLEIAYWKPIDVVLGIKMAEARPSTTMRVRQRLLEEKKFLGHVGSYSGKVMREVVRACLEGLRAFGLEEGADEKDDIVGAMLQRGFYEKVVKQLGVMRA